MFDSVYVFVAGLTALGQKNTLRPANLSCDLEKPWQDGLQLHSHISSVSIFFLSFFFFRALRQLVHHVFPNDLKCSVNRLFHQNR